MPRLLSLDVSEAKSVAQFQGPIVPWEICRNGLKRRWSYLTAWVYHVLGTPHTDVFWQGGRSQHSTSPRKIKHNDRASTERKRGNIIGQKIKEHGRKEQELCQREKVSRFKITKQIEASLRQKSGTITVEKQHTGKRKFDDQAHQGSRRARTNTTQARLEDKVQQ